MASHLLEPATRITLALGGSATATEVLAGEKLRRWAFDYIHAIFDDNVTAIVTPTTSISAPRVSQESLAYGESNTTQIVELLKYVFLGNFLGLPGVSVPVGSDSLNNGLPVGLMLTGAQWSEDTLLRIAAAANGQAMRPAAAVDLFAEASKLAETARM